MTMIFKRYGLQQFTQQFYNILYDILEMAGQDYIKSLSQILKIFREFLKNPCKYFRMAFETCCSWCWVPGCCCSLRRKFIFRVEQISFSKTKMLFPKWNYSYHILQKVLQHRDSRLGQFLIGVGDQMKLAVQKKGGEF